MRAAVDLISFADKLAGLGRDLDLTPLAGGEGSGVSNRSRPKAGEVAYEAARMQLEFASQLMTIGERYADLFLDRTRRFGAAMSPPDRQPAVRLSCKASPACDPEWQLFIYNAAPEPRSMELRSLGSWCQAGAPVEASCAPRFNGGDELIAAKTDKCVRIGLPPSWRTALPGPGRYVAYVEVRMIDRTIGRLELTLESEGS
jgi:hypothetical protein